MMCVVADTPHGQVRRGAIRAVSGTKGKWFIIKLCSFLQFRQTIEDKLELSFTWLLICVVLILLFVSFVFLIIILGTGGGGWG